MLSKGSALIRAGIGLTKELAYGRLRDKRQVWEKDWSQEDFEPFWKTDRIPGDVKDAVDSQWFQPGAPLLDIGCGSGEITVWLAGQGYEALGVDFSESAIRRARSQQSQSRGSLEFRVLDICRETLEPGRFHSLLDRGCFHHIPKTLLPLYAENIASCAAKGARLLLLSRNRRRRQVERVLARSFEIARAEKTWLIEEGSGVEPYPGMAFWMVRR